MNVERLRAVQSEEREADSLRALPDTFYREVSEYLEELREERTEAAKGAKDPFDSTEVRRLTGEIKDVEELAEAIYERRVGKLVKQASLAAAGVPADEEGLTTEEAELFADLVAQIEDHRAEVLASFDGDRRGRRPRTEPSAANDEDASGAASDDDDGAPSFDASEAMGGDPTESGPPSPGGRTSDETPPAPPDDPPIEPDAAGADDAESGEGGAGEGATESTGGDDDSERVTLRITRDVGEVFGVDERVYDLASEDVVTLPAVNAKPLLDRDAAEKIE